MDHFWLAVFQWKVEFLHRINLLSARLSPGDAQLLHFVSVFGLKEHQGSEYSAILTVERWVASLFSLNPKFKSSEPPFEFWPGLLVVLTSPIYRTGKRLDHLTLVHLTLRRPSICHLLTAGGWGTSTPGRSEVHSRAHTHSHTHKWRKPTQI